MNLLLLEPEEVDGDRVELRGRRARHVAEVLGAVVGDRVRVGVVRGATGHAVVTAVSADDLTLEVELGEAAEQRPPVDLVLAMPRPRALGRTLRVAAQLGVGRIDLVSAWKVDKSYWQSRVLAPERLAAQLRLGCEQGVSTWVPELEVHPVLTRFLRQGLAQREPDAARLICHPQGAVAIEAAQAAVPSARSTPGPRSTMLAIGPEGGWIDRELASFAELGFTAVSLSTRVLRVEVAVAAALAQLELLARR